MKSNNKLFIETPETLGKLLTELLDTAGFKELLNLNNPDLLILLASSDPVILALLARGPFSRKRIALEGHLVEEMVARVLKVHGRRHSRNSRKDVYQGKKCSYATCRQRKQFAKQSAALLQRLDPTLKSLEGLEPWHVASVFAWGAVRHLTHKSFNCMGTFWRDCLIVLGYDPKDFLPMRNELILQRIGVTDRYVPGSIYRGFKLLGESPEEMVETFRRAHPTMGASTELGWRLALRPLEMVGFQPKVDFDQVTGRSHIVHMTKGGRRRNGDGACDQEAVRRAVEAAVPHANATTGSLIPDGYTRKQWMRKMRYVAEKNGYTRRKRGVTLYSFRHEGGHEVYEAETGFPPPVAGGPELPAEADLRGRRRHNRLFGHGTGRLGAGNAYLGRSKHRHRSEPARGTRPSEAERKQLRGPFARRRKKRRLR